MTFGTDKLEWCAYPMVKKIWRYGIRFDRIHERDGWTDGWTLHEATSDTKPVLFRATYTIERKTT